MRNSLITESNILPHLKDGNEKAFRFIFDRYYEQLCVIADSYVHDSYIAETIVGDIIFNLWEIHHDLSITHTLRSYLIRSVRNRCINYLKQEYICRETSMNHLQSGKEIEELFFIDEKHPLDMLMEQESISKIERIIEEMPQECSAIFKLSRFEDKKYEEIAQTLNISINTVKYHMKNALLYLRNNLGEYIVLIMLIINTVI